MKGRDVQIVARGMARATEGLAAAGRPEMLLSVKEPRLLPAAEAMLRWFAGYLVDRKARIRPGEYVRWGHWVLAARAAGARIELYEALPDGAGYTPGVTRTLSIHAEQTAACARLRAAFDPPFLDATAWIDAECEGGGFPVRMAREEASPPASGWRFAAGAGGPGREIRLRELQVFRPALTEWLALPPGWRGTLSADGAATPD